MVLAPPVANPLPEGLVKESLGTAEKNGEKSMRSKKKQMNKD
jgi:hypothetical protein